MGIQPSLLLPVYTLSLCRFTTPLLRERQPVSQAMDWQHTAVLLLSAHCCTGALLMGAAIANLCSALCI